jgi:arsenate reductase (thioredoxin)
MAERKRVLFVCIENANRSQMAEAFARAHGRERIEALSAGSRPSDHVNPRAVGMMAELGYDLTEQRPKPLEDMRGRFDAVILMGCGDSFPWLDASLREDWELPDARDLDDDEYRAVRDEIGRRVKALLESI